MMATNIKNRSVHCSMVSGCLSFGVSVTLEEGCTIDASSLICNITCLLACGAPLHQNVFKLQNFGLHFAVHR